jgi:hypothetical protein
MTPKPLTEPHRSGIDAVTRKIKKRGLARKRGKHPSRPPTIVKHGVNGERPGPQWAMAEKKYGLTHEEIREEMSDVREYDGDATDLAFALWRP